MNDDESVEQLKFERDEARRMCEERSTSYALFPALLAERDELRLHVLKLQQECEQETRHLKAADAELSAVRHAKDEGCPQWQPIETAPNNEEWCLVYWPNYGVMKACRDLSADGAWFTTSGALLYPTHWMPLPDPFSRASASVPE